MPVVHQHGPCSPLADNRNGKAPSHAEILAADQRRAEYIHRRVAETTGRARRRKQGAPVVRGRAGHGKLRGARPPRHAGGAVHGGVRHRQRHDVGAVPAVRGLLLPAEGASLRPHQVRHLRQHLLLLVLLLRPLRQRLLRRPLPVRHPVRRRLLHHRLLRPRHPHPGLRHHQEFPVRVRREEPWAVREGGGAAGPRPRQDVAAGAGVRQVRRRVRVLPPGDVGRDGVPGPGAGRAGGERAPDADAGGQGPDVLLRGDDGHQGGRARAAHPGLRLLHRRHAGGLRHGDHAAPAVGVRAAAVGVLQGDAGPGVQRGPGVLDPRHLLRPDGAQGGEHRAARGVAGVPGRRVPGRGRVGDPVRGGRVAGVPGVRAQR
ncbi:Microtubule-associated protein MAP65-1a [Zea mays]|uniref:Microtubule-associated protein MAP65-1a n=1 Tax=Zea mays TaxID=4577 RepID=A0A1D6LRY7_MAIZE|nr:Microtubule-associated protein MAP65-1a [Zea mays]